MKALEKQSQRLAVLQHLQSGKSLTSMEAFELFGATRLSAIVFDLKKMGYNIICDRETSVNRYGESVQYGVYSLIKEG